MFDAFPYDEWSETITTFWTFGGRGRHGHDHPHDPRCAPDGRFADRVGADGGGKLDRQAAMLKRAMGPPARPDRP